jgi:voltage-gated potassium channel Kch
MISWILVLHIFRRARPITAVSIQAAIAVYLLFGLGWANAYLLVMQRNPHSFHSTVGLSSSSSVEWYYYSYVTLTTLGYGEITPSTRVARALATGEAVTGQLYLAVLIARLIGMEIIYSQQKLTQNTS